MSPPILSREGEKRPISQLSRLRRETRETNERIKLDVIPLNARQHWIAAISRLSRMPARQARQDPLQFCLVVSLSL